MPISLGYYAIHNQAMHASQPAAERIAALLTDRRWPWQPSLVRPTQFPGRPAYAWPSGKVPAGKLRDTVTDILRSSQTTGIHLVTSRQDTGNHAWLNVRSGQSEDNANHDAAFPFDALAMCRTMSLPAGKRIGDWLELVHELTIALDAPHAVIWAGTDERPIVAMQFGVGGSRPDMVVDSPRYEITRVARSRAPLGARFVRPPAWGTYLAPAHVAAVGGRERIVAVVAPPVVREVGNLLYVQLSERVDDAVAPETETRRRVFAELLEPITVPRPVLSA